MSVINILSPHVADLIAAGEVVERPASVIKELIENAFDAGAKNVICEIRNGGMAYIRVTDDGCGMAPEDAGIAFTRHATSKLSTEEGLERISTMGFRGEALAAISSVSHIELLTRRKGAAEGTRVLLDGGDIQDMTPCGCPDGTTMIIRDLFFNTPARQKFMKTDRSEASACITAAQRCALARPDVSVRMLRDGNDEFFTPGDGRIDSCLYALLGREETASMLNCTSSSDGLSVKGFIGSPSDCRGNRAHQFFFVNSRFIRSQLLQTALEQAYRNTLLTGRYPSCALYLEIPYGTVDVNVHPAKTEVRFGSEKTVFDFIYQAAKFALEAENRLVSVTTNSPQSSGNSAGVSASAAAASSPAPAAPFSAGVPVAAPSPVSAAVSAGVSAAAVPTVVSVETSVISSKNSSDSPPTDVHKQPPVGTSFGEEPVSLFSANSSVNSFVGDASPEKDTFSSGTATYEFRSALVTGPESEQDHPAQPLQFKQETDSGDSIAAPVEKIVENSVQNVENFGTPLYRILGEAFRTYIIVEQNGELLLIDKHAAHERMIFDRLRRNTGELLSQMLLIPETVRLSPEDCELLEQNEDLLTRLGFEIDRYGENTWIIRGVPADMVPGDAAASVEEICDRIRSGTAPDPDTARDEILHTVACKAAIKAGWDTQTEELDKIVSAVCSGAVKYCPHGRPVSTVITRTDLDKLFKRIL